MTFSVAVRVPGAVGVKTTLIVQFAPAGTLAPQVFVWLKFALLVPVMVIPEICSVALPVLVKVTANGGLGLLIKCTGNLRLVGDKLTTGPPPSTVWVKGGAELGLKLESPE